MLDHRAPPARAHGRHGRARAPPAPPPAGRVRRRRSRSPDRAWSRSRACSTRRSRCSPECRGSSLRSTSHSTARRALDGRSRGSPSPPLRVRVRPPADDVPRVRARRRLDAQPAFRHDAWRELWRVAAGVALGVALAAAQLLPSLALLSGAAQHDTATLTASPAYILDRHKIVATVLSDMWSTTPGRALGHERSARRTSAWSWRSRRSSGVFDTLRRRRERGATVLLLVTAVVAVLLSLGSTTPSTASRATSSRCSTRRGSRPAGWSSSRSCSRSSPPWVSTRPSPPHRPPGDDRGRRVGRRGVARPRGRRSRDAEDTERGRHVGRSSPCCRSAAVVVMSATDRRGPWSRPCSCSS